MQPTRCAPQLMLGDMIHPLSCFYEFIVRQFNRLINAAMYWKSSCYSGK